MDAIDSDGLGFAGAQHGVDIGVDRVLAPPVPRGGAVPGFNPARFDPAPQLDGRLRPEIWILFQTRLHDGLEVWRNRDAFFSKGRRLLIQVLTAHLCH